MEVRNDLEMAMDLLKDEISGVKEYGSVIESCEDQELKNIAINILADEKKHVEHLILLVNTMVKKMVG